MALITLENVTIAFEGVVAVQDVNLTIERGDYLVIVGENDTKFIGDSPYGDNRVARMKSLQKNLQDHGVHTELTILPGFAHEGGEKERVQAAQHFFEAYL